MQQLQEADERHEVELRQKDVQINQMEVCVAMSVKYWQLCVHVLLVVTLVPWSITIATISHTLKLTLPMDYTSQAEFPLYCRKYYFGGVAWSVSQGSLIVHALAGDCKLGFFRKTIPLWEHRFRSTKVTRLFLTFTTHAHAQSATEAHSASKSGASYRGFFVDAQRTCARELL